MSKHNRKVVETAYCQVNSISRNEVYKPEHQRIINKALTDVWSYPGLFPNENEALQDRRLDLTGPANGSVTDLAQHFKELYPTEFENMTGWQVIFTMYNRMNSSEPIHNAAAEVPVNAAEVEKEEGLSDISHDSIIKEEKETNNMNEATQATLADLNAAEAGLSSAGTDVTMREGAMPAATEDAKASMQAVKAALDEQNAERVAYTKNAFVQEIVLAKPQAKEIAVAGSDAVGIVANPEKAFSDFCEKTGAKVDSATGNVTFSKVPTDSIDKAKEIYDYLKEVQVAPEKTCAVYFSESMGTIKGYKLVDDKGGAGIYIKPADLLTTIFDRTVGLLRTSQEGVQIQARKAKKQNTKGKKGTGTARNNAANFSGIASVAITNKKDALASMGTYHKEIIKDEKEVRSGMKSAMSCKFFRQLPDENGEAKIGTYRIPLKVEQYKLDILDKDKEVLGTMSAGVGNQVAPIDLNNEDAIRKMVGEFTEMAAQAAAKGLGGEDSFFAAIRTSAAEFVAKEAEAQAADMAGVEL